MKDHQSPAEQIAAAALDARRASSLLRSRRIVEPIDATRVRVDGRELINFSGNDYLGLSHHPAVIAAIHGSNVAGSGAAALVSGRTEAHADAEQAVAAWKGVDDAVLLPSGYQANLAAVQAMAAIADASGKRVRFLMDRLVHASLIDAVRSGEGELRVFPHNGIAKLERLLSHSDPSWFDVVITESIFSMDGDAADLDAIVELKRRHAFGLIVDEAHATGIYGDNGAGLVSKLGLTREIDLGIATFSKAIGVVGGAVYGSRAMVDAVVNFGRAYVFTTSPPAGVAMAITQAIEVAKSDSDRRDRLWANVEKLRAGIRLLGLSTVAGDSPIVPIVIGDEQRTLDLAKRLLDAGFLVIPVRPPTVPKGTSRLRVTVGSEHSGAQIGELLRALGKLD